MHIAVGRRALLRNLGVGGAGAALLSGLGPSGRAAAQSSPQPGAAGRAWFELGLLPDPIMESQLLHYLAAVYSAQADVGEVLDTASRIVATDRWSWPREWTATAERVRKLGDASQARGRPLSAGSAYLRAANYYRAALIHHPDPVDRGVLETGRKAVATYDKALALLDIPARAVRIPYERTSLPGYVFRSASAKAQAPLLIMIQGRDAWPEESKYIIDGCLARGYHCLILHAPGQGMAIREQRLPFRPDWERVMTPVLDFAVRLAGVDARRVGLLGLSMGGALVPRAAAFDKRWKVLIANPGVLNWGAAMFAQFEQYFADAMPLLDREPVGFDALLREQMAAVPLFDWYLRDSMNKHGVSTPSALMRALREFDNTEVVERIRCRTLVMDGTAEMFSAGQAKSLFDALRCPKDYMLFTAEDTGLLHCQEGAQAVASQRMFDWLDDVI